MSQFVDGLVAGISWRLSREGKEVPFPGPSTLENDTASAVERCTGREKVPEIGPDCPLDGSSARTNSVRLPSWSVHWPMTPCGA